MLDIGGWELLVIAAIALIVVGPKELPGLVRTVGRWVAKARNLAREFQSGMEAAAKEADVDEFRQIGSIKSDLEKQVRDMGRKAQSMIDDEDGDETTAARRPEPRRSDPREASRRDAARPAERVEPDFDPERRRSVPPPPRRREDPVDRGDDDEALDRFQSGMRRRD